MSYTGIYGRVGGNSGQGGTYGDMFKFAPTNTPADMAVRQVGDSDNWLSGLGSFDFGGIFKDNGILNKSNLQGLGSMTDFATTLFNWDGAKDQSKAATNYYNTQSDILQNQENRANAEYARLNAQRDANTAQYMAPKAVV